MAREANIPVRHDDDLAAVEGVIAIVLALHGGKVNLPAGWESVRSQILSMAADLREAGESLGHRADRRLNEAMGAYS